MGRFRFRGCCTLGLTVIGCEVGGHRVWGFRINLGFSLGFSLGFKVLGLGFRITGKASLLIRITNLCEVIQVSMEFSGLGFEGCKSVGVEQFWVEAYLESQLPIIIGNFPLISYHFGSK